MTLPVQSKPRVAPASPFDLASRDTYRRWRDDKLRAYPSDVADLVVEIADPRAITPSEHAALVSVCWKTNMVVYASRVGSEPDKDIPRRLGRQFGLEHLDNNMLADDDAISSITAVAAKSGRGYIPYSNRRLLWHTDGYYNPPTRRVRAFVLHCVRPALAGGDNSLLDPELAYLLLRDANPDHIRALMAPDAMTIPANDEAGGIRASQTGPVFCIDPQTGGLHMRYTARTRSVVWKDDPATRAAVQSLEQLLAEDSRYVFRHRLSAGQGLLCNNVLHNRTAFVDADDPDAARLIYRARYYDRIAGAESIGVA